MDSLTALMASASLIISHAGAGSISEALYFRKPLIVCINETLMDNHQRELADALADRRYCLETTPSHICQYLSASAEDFTKLVVYPTADPDIFSTYLHDIIGWTGHED